MFPPYLARLSGKRKRETNPRSSKDEEMD